MSCVCVLQNGHIDDGCALPSTLCKYVFRKGALFVLNWARVRRARQRSISSEQIICGGGVILSCCCMYTYNRYMYMAHVFVFVVVPVWGFMGMVVV